MSAKIQTALLGRWGSAPKPIMDLTTEEQAEWARAVRERPDGVTTAEAARAATPLYRGKIVNVYQVDGTLFYTLELPSGKTREVHRSDLTLEPEGTKR